MGKTLISLWRGTCYIIYFHPKTDTSVKASSKSKQRTFLTNFNTRQTDTVIQIMNYNTPNKPEWVDITPGFAHCSNPVQHSSTLLREREPTFP